MSIVRVLPRVAAVLAALFLLNASLTFYDVWPTPGVEWHGHASVELAAAVLLLGRSRAWRRPGRAMPWLIGGLSAVWMALVLGRYVDVMSPALYGRPINLYWDLRHVAAVAAMMTDAVATPAGRGGRRPAVSRRPHLPGHAVGVRRGDRRDAGAGRAQRPGGAGVGGGRPVHRADRGRGDCCRRSPWRRR